MPITAPTTAVSTAVRTLAVMLTGPPTSPSGAAGSAGLMDVLRDLAGGHLAHAVVELAGYLAAWWATRWPVIAPAATVSVWVAVAIGVTSAAVTITAGATRWRARLTDAEGGQWLHLLAPAGPVSSQASHAVWQVLADTLRRAPWRAGTGAPVLAAEWHADPAGLRAGIWAPGSIDAAQLADALGRAWPGASVTPVTGTPVTGPRWQHLPLSALTLIPLPLGACPRRWRRWLSLIPPDQHRATHPASTAAGNVDPVAEPLRAVLAALAERAPGEHALVQLILSPPRPTRPRLADRALFASGERADRGGFTTPRSALATGSALATVVCWWISRAGAGVARAGAVVLTGFVGGVLELLAPRSSRRPATRRASTGATSTGLAPGVVQTETVGKAIHAKQAQPPHLCLTLRVVVGAGPIRGRVRSARVRRGLCARIASGFGLAAPAARWHARPALWAVAERVAARVPRRRGHYITLAEGAALWHLPADPDRWGLPAATGRERPPAHILTRLPYSTPPSASTSENNPVTQAAHTLSRRAGWSAGRAANTAHRHPQPTPPPVGAQNSGHTR